MNKISSYIFVEILKGFFLVFFIFLSIAWLLQFTRLITLTNLIQVDILSILFLSLYLIPNLISILIPFVVIFGLIISFIKLNKDRELISIYTLGLNINSKEARFYGISLDGESGVNVDNISMRGSSGISFTQMDESHFKKELSNHEIALIILQFGGNSVPYFKTKESVKSYGQSFKRQI
mgnify:CR=1 FL=1